MDPQPRADSVYRLSTVHVIRLVAPLLPDAVPDGFADLSPDGALRLLGALRWVATMRHCPPSERQTRTK